MAEKPWTGWPANGTGTPLIGAGPRSVPDGGPGANVRAGSTARASRRAWPAGAGSGEWSRAGAAAGAVSATATAAATATATARKGERRTGSLRAGGRGRVLAAGTAVRCQRSVSTSWPAREAHTRYGAGRHRRGPSVSAWQTPAHVDPAGPRVPRGRPRPGRARLGGVAQPRPAGGLRAGRGARRATRRRHRGRRDRRRGRRRRGRGAGRSAIAAGSSSSRSRTTGAAGASAARCSPSSRRG